VLDLVPAVSQYQKGASWYDFCDNYEKDGVYMMQTPSTTPCSTQYASLMNSVTLGLDNDSIASLIPADSTGID
jgi:hypothetical protein